MSSGRYNRANTADRYRQIAAEYAGLSQDTTDPFLRPYYLRIAEDYLAQSQAELRALEQERVTGLASGTTTPSFRPQPNHPS
jgi:hypothetical protein